MSAICSFDSLKICFFIDKMIDCVEDCHYFENGLQILVLNVIFLLAVKWLQKGEFRVT